MGAVCSSNGAGGDKDAAKKSHLIEKRLAADGRKARPVKVLILGTGDSGKSTILKQMRLIYDSGFGERDRELFRQRIYRCLVESLVGIMRGMDRLEIAMTPIAKETAGPLWIAPELNDGQVFPAQFKAIIRSTWEDPILQEAIQNNPELVYPECLDFFMNNLDRIFEPSYKPTDDDCLRVRWSSSGIIETHIPINGQDLLMVDVGGQRTERRKWMYAFEDITAILFVASLAGFDSRLAEAPEDNQMAEALTIFLWIARYKVFSKIPIILFLNKKDLFYKKLESGVNVQDFFPDYKGDPFDAASVINYFKDSFLNQLPAPTKDSDPPAPVYVHLTTAINTNLVRTVMRDVTDVILRQRINAAFL